MIIIILFTTFLIIIIINNKNRPAKTYRPKQNFKIIYKKDKNIKSDENYTNRVKAMCEKFRKWLLRVKDLSSCNSLLVRVKPLPICERFSCKFIYSHTNRVSLLLARTTPTRSTPNNENQLFPFLKRWLIENMIWKL